MAIWGQPSAAPLLKILIYYVQVSWHNKPTGITEHTDRFHHYHNIFKTTGVCNDFNLPWQHSLFTLPKTYGAPNSLFFINNRLENISKQGAMETIPNAIKALGQMLLMNQWLNKLTASHADFEAHGMLNVSPHKYLFCICFTIRCQFGSCTCHHP